MHRLRDYLSRHRANCRLPDLAHHTVAISKNEQGHGVHGFARWWAELKQPC